MLNDEVILAFQWPSFSSSSELEKLSKLLPREGVGEQVSSCDHSGEELKDEVLDAGAEIEL